MKNLWHKLISERTKTLSENSGFTLLELLVTLGIMAVITLFSAPYMSSWNNRSNFNNSMIFFKKILNQAKVESLNRNTATKITITKTNDNYNFKTYYSSTPITSCTAVTTWNLIYNEDWSMDADFVATGLSDICFFRDNSSNGANITISQKNGQTDIASGTISVLVATGFIDVTD